MDTYLFSIHPKWCEKIFNGEKTIEVRKSAPKPPFKVVVYCTKSMTHLYRYDKCIDENEQLFTVDYNKHSLMISNEFNGKVIGEFIVNEVEKLYCSTVPYLNKNNLGYEHFIDNGVYRLNADDGIIFERGDCYIDTMIKNEDLSKMCLSANELFSYCGGFGNHIYTLHITAPVLYDKPKDLGEFYSIKQCKPEYSPFGYQWTWEDRHKRNIGGRKNAYRPVPIECHRCKSLVGGKDYLDEKSGCILFDYECISNYHKPLARPPQSYMRIEEV